MAKFLSDEWMSEADNAVKTDPAFTSAAAGKDLKVQFHVTDVADIGELDYFMSIDGGQTQIAKGELDAPDVTVTSDYETSAGIARGEINTQMAFMTGKIKVAGNLATLMMHQNIISAWAHLSEGMNTEY
jgi:putative sterol carrier protein